MVHSVYEFNSRWKKVHNVYTFGGEKGAQYLGIDKLDWVYEFNGPNRLRCSMNCFMG